MYCYISLFIVFHIISLKALEGSYDLEIYVFQRYGRGLGLSGKAMYTGVFLDSQSGETLVKFCDA